MPTSRLPVCSTSWPGAVALHLGRRRIDAHQLEGDAELRAVVEGDLEHAGGLVHGQGDGWGDGLSSDMR